MEERQMFKATCSACGSACEVPFQPTEGKPVKCRDCFRKNSFGNNRGRSFGGKRNFGGGRNFERKMYDAVCGKCNKECQVPFKPTEGKEVLCKDCYMQNRQ